MRYAFLIALFAAGCQGQSRDLHRDAFVMDGHVHMMMRQYYLGGDMSERYRNGQVDLPRLKDGGIDALFFSIYSPDQYYPRRFETKITFRMLNLALQQIQRNRDKIEIALNASDIERINKSGKMAAFLDLEGSFDLDGDVAILRALYRLGLRSAMLPAHNYTNGFIDSCCDQAKWNGINEQGRAVIREMNRLGMVINVAHGSDQAILQAAEISSDPILYSHGGSQHFVRTTRNISDEAARKIAAKGGVIGLHLGNSFHNRAYYDYRQKGRPFGSDPDALKRASVFENIEAIDKEIAKRMPTEPAGIPVGLRMETDQFVNVLDHWISLVGEDHVSIGSDFDGGPEPARGWKDISDMPKLTEAMLKRGYSEQRIRKVLGLNLLRLIKDVTER